MLWWMDSAAALKCNDYGLEFSLAGHLGKGSVHCRGELVCECTGYCTLGGGVHWGCKFFKYIIKIDQSKITKSHMFNPSL